MTRITFRISEDLKRKMEEREETDWSTFVRTRIKREVDYPNPPRKVRQFVREQILEDENRVELAWALHLLISRSKTGLREDTAKYLFQEEDIEEPLQELESRLSLACLGDLDRDVGRGLTVRESLREELEDSGLLEEIKDACRRRVNDASKEEKALVWFLAREVSEDFDDQSSRVKPHGIGKTHALYTKEEYDVQRVTETLTRLGLVYRGSHSSTQYDYQKHTVPDYALALLEEFFEGDVHLNTGLSTPDRRTIRRWEDDEAFGRIFEWLGGTSRKVDERKEESELNDSYPGGAEEFREHAYQLIRDGILTVDYRPHRRSKGGNSGARPARWRYEITRDTFEPLGESLVEEGFVPSGE